MLDPDASRAPDDSWEERVAAFWSEADDEHPGEAWAALERLLAGRPAGDAASAFERASLHDMLGEEQEAIPLYRGALAGDLDEERRAFAAIQLASSLRNVGRPAEAVALLEPLRDDARLGTAARAFLALALHDLGRSAEALRLVLADLAPSVPLYGRAIGEYAELLTTPAPDESTSPA